MLVKTIVIASFLLSCLIQEPGRYRFFFTLYSAKVDTSDRVKSRVPLDEESVQRTVSYDLNGDGFPEIFKTSYTNCGSGGCDWGVYDGRTKKYIGYVVGSLVYVLRSPRGHYAGLETFFKTAPDTAIVHSYHFMLGRYEESKFSKISGNAIEKYFAAKPSLAKECQELQ